LEDCGSYKQFYVQSNVHSASSCSRALGASGGLSKAWPIGATNVAQAPNPLLVNISARHCHLTQEAVEALFGPGYQLSVHKWLYQDGQFAAKETLTLVGPRSRVISNLRILGPCRNINQVELAYTDAVALGFDIPLKSSGDIEGTPGGMLMGPKGFFEMDKGVIRALRHVHMNPEDAKFYEVKQGDFMKMKVGGPCGITFDEMLVRVDPSFKLGGSYRYR
jgi:putative phosphotransacetylase